MAPTVVPSQGLVGRGVVVGPAVVVGGGGGRSVRVLVAERVTVLLAEAVSLLVVCSSLSSSEEALKSVLLSENVWVHGSVSFTTNGRLMRCGP